jgi:hypothetical protein
MGPPGAPPAYPAALPPTPGRRRWPASVALTVAGAAIGATIAAVTATQAAAGIAPGTTNVLDQTAITSAAALHALSVAVAAFDVASGNMDSVVHESADAMDVRCERLAPR